MKIVPIILCLLAANLGTVRAATVTGSLIGSTGTRKTVVNCVPANPMRVLGTNLVFGVTQTIETDTNGVFSLQLIQGDYRLSIAGFQSAVPISVPDTTNTLSLLDLISTNGLTYIYRTPGALIRVSNLDSAFGFLSEKLTNGPSITFTTITNATGHAFTISLAPQITLAGTTNLITFGTAGDEPTETTNVIKWVSVAITGDTNAYWLPLFQ